MAKVSKSDASSGADISRLAEHLFREESGKLVAVLTAHFGTARLQLAEDVAQEALVRALQTWPYYGVPDKPAAWLMQTARNLTLDALRRETAYSKKEAEITAYTGQRYGVTTPAGAALLSGDIGDETLRLMFTCCHPALPQEGQTALALKTLCGLDVSEIARAFLSSEAAIAKRLTRVRQRIRELEIPFEIPEGEALAERLDGVLQTLYLLFNEGYKASSGEALVRADLCREAIRLATLLAEHPRAGLPRVHALLALMQFNAARLDARIDGEGNMLTLRQQQTAQWDRGMIVRGFDHLAKSAAGGEASAYHYQAAIAGCHCVSEDYDSTDWKQILWFFDKLIAVDPSPVFALNRSVAVAEVHGAEAGIEAVRQIDRTRLENYHLYYALLGEFEAKLDNATAARNNFQRAAELTDSTAERRFLARRMAELR